MQHDLFISYARADNTPDQRVTAFRDKLHADFKRFAGRDLRSFFDADAISSMDDWRDRILTDLRDSRLFVAFLTPKYLESDYCEWEVNEYLNGEIARGFARGGIAPIYFVTIDGWEDRDFDEKCADWVTELRRRQGVDARDWDLRPWHGEGEEALKKTEVAVRMKSLGERVFEKINFAERTENLLGNVPAHNTHFTGRRTLMANLREHLSKAGSIGVVSAVHGLGGIGKTALATEYAHTFAPEYGGGRWLASCEGVRTMGEALAKLQQPLEIDFNKINAVTADDQIAAVLNKMRQYAKESPADHAHALLILDNVNRTELLSPEQIQKLGGHEWLHIIATTRASPSELHEEHNNRAFFPVDHLSDEESLKLIESFYPTSTIKDADELAAAKEIVKLLAGFTLVVETVAVLLGQGAITGDITCCGLLERLRGEGLEGLEAATASPEILITYGVKALTATLAPTLERLSKPEEPARIALVIASALPPDAVALPWVRAVLGELFPEYAKDAEPGYPDPWKRLVARLMGMRLWTETPVADKDGQPLTVRMHRLVQEVVRINAGNGYTLIRDAAIAHAKDRSDALCTEWVDHPNRWEIDPLIALAELLMANDDLDGAFLANQVSGPLQNLARFNEIESLLRPSLKLNEAKNGPHHPNVAAVLNNLAQLLQATNRMNEAEPLMHRALSIDEHNYGEHHPNVAIRLNNLARLLQDTSRMGEAEPLMRRALSIDEHSYGEHHPKVAPNLNNLASLLTTTNRMNEAEPLIRRALSIDEKSYGEHHPNVAIRLNNLASLLQTTNRMDEAEPLMRRMIDIFLKFTTDTGHMHPHLHDAINNYAGLLMAMGQSQEAATKNIMELLARYGVSLGE